MSKGKVAATLLGICVSVVFYSSVKSNSNGKPEATNETSYHQEIGNPNLPMGLKPIKSKDDKSEEIGKVVTRDGKKVTVYDTNNIYLAIDKRTFELVAIFAYDKKEIFADLYYIDPKDGFVCMVVDTNWWNDLCGNSRKNDKIINENCYLIDLKHQKIAMQSSLPADLTYHEIAAYAKGAAAYLKDEHKPEKPTIPGDEQEMQEKTYARVRKKYSTGHYPRHLGASFHL